MRVTLDLDTTTHTSIAGTVTCDATATHSVFEGWLELMRLLELISASQARGPDER